MFLGLVFHIATLSLHLMAINKHYFSCSNTAKEIQSIHVGVVQSGAVRCLPPVS